MSFSYPLSVYDFCTHALYDAKEGYYARVNPLETDYITAPEISQVFGEIIGVWCAHQMQTRVPPPLHLIELGPGRGTMMADVLRVLAPHAPTLCVHLVDKSPVLSACQKEQLAAYHNIYWHDTLESVPDGPALILANEFFDALPIHQSVYDGQQWVERHVHQDENGALSFTTSSVLTPYTPPADHADSETIWEYCPDADSVMEALCRRLKRQGGAALIIDYGDDITPWYGDTLQAIRQHQRVSPLTHVGQADLTHHVDFHHLKTQAIAAGLEVSPILTQRDFLYQWGVDVRLEQLSKNKTIEEKSQLMMAATRLLSAREMGVLFKVLEIASTVEKRHASTTATNDYRSEKGDIG